MEIYLPIAHLSVDILSLIALGAVVGLISGLLGIGGAFLLSPILIFIGISPSVAVASQANQIAAATFSAALAHQYRRNVDFKMGIYLLVGGLLGSAFGVGLVALLKKLGVINIVIPLVYVLFLASIGSLMLVESIKTMRHKGKKEPKPLRRLYKPMARYKLPFRILFRQSRLYISILLPVSIGFGVGILSALLGIGGGLVLVPAMVYFLRMPTPLAIGTSTFQMFFVALNVTFLQAALNHTVDIVLALLLMVGGVVGAQIGATYATKLKPYILRFLLAIIVLMIGLRMLINLLIAPPAAQKTVAQIIIQPTKFADFIADFANHSPILYGLVCCFIAVIIGWLANSIFKKIKTYRQLAE